MRMSAIAIATLLISSCVISSASQRVLDTREETIAAEGLQKIDLDVRAGDLEVIGKEGASEVILEAEFRGRPRNDEDALAMLKDMQLSHSIEDGTLKILTRIASDWANRSASIDLRVTVPSALALSIEDTSGDIDVRQITGRLSIEDRSGDITLSTIGNSLRIDDSSGDIDGTDLEGPVTIEDSSGDITLSGVGDTDVTDSSGDIEIVNVQGSIVVEDSSGDIEVSDVDGDFEVRRDRSGDIRHRGVRGTVRLPARKR